MGMGNGSAAPATEACPLARFSSTVCARGAGLLFTSTHSPVCGDLHPPLQRKKAEAKRKKQEAEKAAKAAKKAAGGKGVVGGKTVLLGRGVSEVRICDGRCLCRWRRCC